jgi:hypothetical protein
VGPDVKVVLAGRPVDREVIERELHQHGVPFELLELSQLTIEEMASIARSEFPEISEKVALQLAKAFGPNLFLLRAATKFVRAGENPMHLVQSGRIRGLVAQRFVREAAAQLSTLCDASRAQQLLLEAALDVPLSNEGASTEEATLREAGLLRVVGSTLRFRADVEGDLVLGYLLEQAWARARLDEFLRNEKDDSLLRKVRNLAAAGPGHPAVALRSILLRWMQAASITDRWHRRQVLEVLPHCARLVPGEVISLCETYAASRSDHTTDDFGPIAIATARAGQVNVALRFYRRILEASVKQGTYSSYKFPRIADELVSPVYLSSENIVEVCQEFIRWLSDGTVSLASAEFIRHCLGVVTSSVAKWDSMDGATFTRHESPIAPTAPVLAWRKGAISVLEAMLDHQQADVRLEAVRALSDHGKSHAFHTRGDSLKEIQQLELQQLLPRIERLLAHETDVRILDELEQGLIHRWTAMQPGADEAERLLRNSQRGTLLRAYQLVTRAWEFHLDVRALIDNAPRDKRWQWWVERKFDREGNDLDKYIEDTVEALERDYPGTSGVQQVLEAIVGTLRAPMLLDAWVRRDPALFRRARGSVKLDRVAAALDEALRRYDFLHGAFDLVGEIEQRVGLDAEPSEVRKLVDDMPRVPVSAITSIAASLVSHQRLDYRLLGLELVQHRPDLEASTLLGLLATALRDGAWREGWECIWTFFQHNGVKAQLVGHAIHTILGDRMAEALSTEDWFVGGNDGWCFEQLGEMVHGGDPQMIASLLRRAMTDDSSWNPNIGKISAPLLRTDVGRRLVIELCSEWIAQGLSADACERFLEHAAGEEPLPSEFLAPARECIGGASASLRMAGVIVLSQLRDSPAACAEVAELSVGASDLRDLATAQLSNFALPKGPFMSDVGEAPPAFVALLDVLTGARAFTTTPEAVAKLVEIEQYVRRATQGHIERGQENLDPR